MKQIAIYGKGGIGKSTVSANLSVSLALTGKKVLQVGCDPKHDSTRQLMHGRKITTVLDYLRAKNPINYKAKDILFEGWGNVGCVEAGGPIPGVGCAGRGIISTFELLDNLKIKNNYDIVLYDVMGDVVCGGFAVPIRNEYANIIFIVTSGEFMSLYAANNILRGISNYDSERNKIAGIIYNQRDIQDEDERVLRFAHAVGLPVCVKIPRDNQFNISENANMTLVQKFNDSSISVLFKKLAREILNGYSLYKAVPLSDEELENVVLNKKIYSSIPEPEPVSESKNDVQENLPINDAISPTRYLSKNVVHHEPLYGCAFNGAVSINIHLRDAAVIAHSPKNCAYISYQTTSSLGRRGLFEKGVLLPVSLTPNFECTEMNETEMIFGGIEALREKVREVKLKKPRAIIVISSCPSGIIGDDIDRVKYLEEPNMPIITIKADGNIAGDYFQGMLMSYILLAEKIIKKDVPTIPDTLNVVFEKAMAKNTDSNFKIIENLLYSMNIKVNCRFLYETTFHKLENFLSAPLNLLAYDDDYTGEILRNFFEERYKCKFLNETFPVGFDETIRWLENVAHFFKKEENAADIIKQNHVLYKREIDRLKPVLSGKKLMIITYNSNLDWILKTALDTEMQVVKIGILNFSQDTRFRTNLGIKFNLDEDYNKEKMVDDIQKYAPDILLTNYEPSAGSEEYISTTIPSCPDVGFYSGINTLSNWAKLVKLNLQGEWKNDENLFKKYYS